MKEEEERLKEGSEEVLEKEEQGLKEEEDRSKGHWLLTKTTPGMTI